MEGKDNILIDRLNEGWKPLTNAVRALVGETESFAKLDHQIDFGKIDNVEVVDQDGNTYVNHGMFQKLEVSLENESRTLKITLKPKEDMDEKIKEGLIEKINAMSIGSILEIHKTENGLKTKFTSGWTPAPEDLIEEHEVKVTTARYRCPKCMKGYYIHTGIILHSNPPQYKHKCDNCGG